ncbi:MAG: BRO family protein [Tranquillimonas sp.]
MTDLSFTFRGHDIRVLIDSAGNHWWIGRDVCAALELANSRDALANLAEDERGVERIDTLGGPQSVTTINEPGLYRLVFASRKPAAEAFKRWLAHDVLPALRRTGRYALAAGASAARDLPPDAEQWMALVRETRLTYGKAAAARAWARSPLPQVGLAGPDPSGAELDGVDRLVRDFLQDRCEVTGNPQDFLRSGALIDALAAYCADLALPVPGRRTASAAFLRAAEVYRDPSTGWRFRYGKRSDTGYIGLRLT